jgi:hypothetical protein
MFLIGAWPGHVFPFELYVSPLAKLLVVINCHAVLLSLQANCQLYQVDGIYRPRPYSHQLTDLPIKSITTRNVICVMETDHQGLSCLNQLVFVDIQRPYIKEHS